MGLLHYEYHSSSRNKALNPVTIYHFELVHSCRLASKRTHTHAHTHDLVKFCFFITNDYVTIV